MYFSMKIDLYVLSGDCCLDLYCPYKCIPYFNSFFFSKIRVLITKFINRTVNEKYLYHISCHVPHTCSRIHMFSVHLIHIMMCFDSLLEKWESNMIHALNNIQLYISICMRCRRHFTLIRSLANLNGRPAGNVLSSFLSIEQLHVSLSIALLS